MEKIRNVILMGLIIIIFLLNVTIVSAEDPTVIVNPTKPNIKSEITFNAEFSEGGISNVELIVQECNNQICYADKLNSNMIEKETNTFSGSVKLTHKDATYIKYWIDYDLNGESKSYGPIEIDLKKTSSNSNDTPGFELIILFLSILIFTGFISRKRLR